jgi:hypothetical protein
MLAKQSKRIFKEPLLQFMLIGLLIFVADAVASHFSNDVNNIVIDDNQLSQLVEIFKVGQGRLPSDDEVDSMIIKWTQNEILYREAQKIGLDQGDEMIRSRLVLKMQNVLFNNVTIEVPPKEELIAWFEEYRDNYDKPPQYTLEQFYLGPNLESAKFSGSQRPQAFADALASRLGNQAVSQTYANELRKYANRPLASLETLFAKPQIEKLLATPVNHWQVITSDKGLHLARITQVTEATPAIFEELENQIIKDWKQFSNQSQMMQQTTDIAKRYTINITANNQNEGAAGQ